MLRRTLKSPKYFKKVLVANRGEIACRIFKTCKRLGIKTVAVYSVADDNTKFVRMADEAICIGPAPSKESYLRIPVILDAIKKTGADAVHPGYGFLSENFEFSRALAAAGVTFIGPTERAIHAMGDKIQSKILAKEAKVNTIPGFNGEITNEEHCIKVCHEIGYPVMIKASAGGGGKGMRVAFNDKEAVEFLKLCKEEALASFGDDRMLVEKFVDKPRHIEIQIIADKNGNTLYLPERECSIQRRNQKVIEEAPSPFINPETRKAMGEQAAALARAVGYHTAGTVEMMVDGNRNFYFLEMNTRLQVEHPITEEITGIDIVEEMMRAAAGLDLSVKQSDVKINGWATECRVYAEDPFQNYVPQIGRLSGYEEPVGDGVRVDSGILEGSQISVYYDPMISKLVTHGKDREESLVRMKGALDTYVVRGLRNNIPLLRSVIMEPVYASGNFTTLYLKEQFPEGFQGNLLSAEEKSFVSAVAAIMRVKKEQLYGSLESVNTFDIRITGPAKQGVVSSSEVTVQNSQLSGEYLVGGKRFQLDWICGSPKVKVTENGNVHLLQYVNSGVANVLTIQYQGTPYDVRVCTPLQAKLLPVIPPPVTVDLGRFVPSPMPGAIVNILVEVGQSVKAGEDVITLEAMKMRNRLKSPTKGTIKKIMVKVGQTVDDGELLVEVEPEIIQK